MACSEHNYWYTPEQRVFDFPRARRRASSVPAAIRDKASTVRDLGPDFTGRHGDTYYYLGRKWSGPTNMLGKTER